MFGSVTEFFFRHIAGLQQAPGTRGYSELVRRRRRRLNSNSGHLSTPPRHLHRHPPAPRPLSLSNYVIPAQVFKPSVLMTPQFLSVCGNLSSVTASLLRPHGRIAAAWNCAVGHTGVTYTVQTPVGVTSTVHLPVASKSAQTIVSFIDGDVSEPRVFPPFSHLNTVLSLF